MSKLARWEGDQFVVGDEFERDGRKVVYREVFSDFTPDSFTQTINEGESGGELKLRLTIHATKSREAGARRHLQTPVAPTALSLLVRWMKWRAELAWESIGSGGDRRRELAGDEGVEGAEAIGEFGVAQAALTVKPPQKVDGGAFSLLGIASQTTRDQVPVRIGAELGLWHDMVKAASHGRELTQTIKTMATLPRVDGPAEGCRLQEIHVLRIDSAWKAGGQTTADSTWSIGACSADLVRQEHLNHVSGFAALDQAQDTARNEATYRPARRVSAEANAAGKPGNRKPEAELPFKATMAQKVRIDDAVSDRKAQPRCQRVLQLFPDLCGVGFLDFHGLVQSTQAQVRAAREI